MGRPGPAVVTFGEGNQAMVISQIRPTRRDVLRMAAGGFGSIALNVMLSELSRADARPAIPSGDPLRLGRPTSLRGPSASSSST